MRAFDISGMLSQQSSHRLRVPIDPLRMHSDKPTASTLFDDLQIVPVGTWLLVRGRSASSSIVRDPSPCCQHGLTVAAFPIGGHSWRRLGVATFFELGH